MSDDATTAETVAEVAPTEAATVKQADPDALAAEVQKWKELSRKNEDRAKANAEAAKRLKELDDAAKPAEERAAQALAEARAEAEQAKADVLRFRTAAKFKLGEDDLELLGTGSEEQLEARGQRIGQLLAVQSELAAVKAELEALKSGKPPAGRPVENLKPGATPVQTASDDDSYPSAWLPTRRAR